MTSMASDAPHRLDVAIGRRIRERRRVIGISQGQLARAIGVTFQQVQKYERGANRVSASKLYEIASALRSPVSYFFDGLADPAAEESLAAQPSEESTVHAFLMTAEGLELAKLFPRIARGPVRRRMLDLLRALVGDEGDDEDQEG
jgi:transcriptional regulator with XRE-family HTH domain